MGGGGEQGKRKVASDRLAGSCTGSGGEWTRTSRTNSNLKCFFLRASTVNDAETSAYFHDVSVTIQHTQEKDTENMQTKRG